MNVGRLAERLGLVPRRKGRAVILCATSPVAFQEFASLVAEVSAKNPRVNFILVSDNPGRFDAPQSLAGISEVLAMPLAIRPCLSLFLARTRPQALLLAAQSEALWAPLASLARRKGVALHRGRPTASSLQASILDETRKYAGGVAGLVRAPLVRVLAARKFREISTIKALAQELGHPKRILCLGNGPSSESDALKARSESDFDAIFRVNHRWLDRGLFSRPHMVFVAGSKPLRRITSPAVFCAQNRRRADRIRLACLHLSGTRRLVVADELGVLRAWNELQAAGFGPFAPTNGVVMLAVAEALEPRQVTLAGIDFFSDPRGAYPGDARTANAYGIFHSAAKEREFTLALLARLHERDVEVELIGDSLNTAWRARGG